MSNEESGCGLTHYSFAERTYRMNLRPYQRECVDAVLDEWDQGNRRTLAVLPTGTGKTIIFSDIIDRRVAGNTGRALILAHRGELLEQAADKLYRSTGLASALEKADSSALGSLFPVTVGSVQSLCRESRLERFPADYYSTIVVDEAHHVLADTYQRVLNHFDRACVLGVTATPDRMDMRNLGQFFETKAYEYRLDQAIRDGWLTPIKALTIPLNVDISNVGVQNGDYKAGELGEALEPYLEAIADEMTEYAKGRKTVVFLPLVTTSQKFRDILEDHGFRAAEVNGNSADRAEILKAFDEGEYDVLCNSMLLTEGWDCPSVDCIVVLRPTKSRALYCQMVGRGTRLSEGKEDLLLLDFLWMTGKHDLVRPAALIAAKPEVAARMTKDLEDEWGVQMELDELEKRASEEVIAEREAAVARELEEMRRRKLKLVDLLQFEFSIMDKDLQEYVPSFPWEFLPPTQKQIALIEKRGLNPDSIDTAGKAKLLIDRLIKRQEAGLATPKQIRVLENKGFRRVGEWTFDDATKMIGRIADNKWRVPRGIDPETYRPGQQIETVDDFWKALGW